jgi:hypothetical protein
LGELNSCFDSGNYIGSDGAKHLVDALKKNKTVTRIRLSNGMREPENNKISNAVKNEIEAALAKNAAAVKAGIENALRKGGDDDGVGKGRNSGNGGKQEAIENKGDAAEEEEDDEIVKRPRSQQVSNVQVVCVSCDAKRNEGMEQSEWHEQTDDKETQESQSSAQRRR